MFNKLLSYGLVGVLSLGLVSTSVLAADDTTKVSTNDVNVTINSGGLELETPSIVNFEDITIKREAHSYNTSFQKTGVTAGNVRVSDLRGSAEGWAVKVQATQFSKGDHELPVGSLTFKGANGVVALDGTNDAMPILSGNIDTIVDEGAILVAKAEKENGLGVYDLSFDDDVIELTVDAKTAKEGKYTSTLSWTLENTPEIK